MAYYHQRQGHRNNHWQKFNNRDRTLTQDSSASSLASTTSSHYHHQPSRQHSQNWSESNGTTFQPSSPKMGQEFRHTPAPNPASGQKDLETLEKLKDSIINNQHEFFRSVPKPTALAKIYMGNTYISPVPPHPEQLPTAQTTPVGDASTGDNQRRGRATSIDSWESRKQVRQAPKRVSSGNLPLNFSPQNGYHHAQSERYEPDLNGPTDSKPHPPGTISPSKSANDLRDSFKSSAPSRGSSHRGSFSRSSFQSPTSAPTRADNQNHDPITRGRALSNPRSAGDFGDDRQRQQKPYSEDRQPRTDVDTTTRSQSLQRPATLTDFERSSDKGPFDAGRDRGDDSGDRSPERDNRRYDRFDRRADERPRIIDNRRNPPDQRSGDSNRQYDNSRSGSVAPSIDRQNDDRAPRYYGGRSTASRTTDYQQPPVQDGGDDRRMPPPPASPIVTDIRPPPSRSPSTHTERTGRTPTADSTPLLPSDATVVRNAVDERTPRQPTPGAKDERKTLEERLSRQPPLSLQDRISMPASSDSLPTSGTPRLGPPLEERLSYPPDRGRDDRGSRSGPASPTVTRSSVGPLNQDDRHLPTGGSRPTTEERGRYPPTSEHVDDRKPPVRSSMLPPNTSENSRAPSLARDDFAGKGTDVRDYRRGGVVGSTTRDPSEARGPDRFGGVDRMDLDRYDDRIPRDTYMRNPSGIPPGPDARDRERGVWDRPRWPESSRNDPYNDDPQYRQGGPASYPQGHGRYQDYDDRPPRWEAKDRQWDPSGPWSDRDRRFIERDSAPASGTANAWETREEREAREQRERNARGRSAYPPPPLSGPDRGYDSRASLSSKISPQGYSPAPVEGRYPSGRDLDPPAIYSQPPIPVSSGPNSSVSNSAPGYSSRVRPRSPSPMSISRDTSRPPIKRQREDFAPGPGISSDYYSPHPPGDANPNGMGSGSDYPPPQASRLPSGPMPSSGPPPGYYGHSSGVNVGRVPRDYHQGPRDGYPPGLPPSSQGYERMPPPRGYSQNNHQRGNYARDDRRYGGPPPRG